MAVLDPTHSEAQQRDLILDALRKSIAGNEVIHLPQLTNSTGGDFALLALASQSSTFGGGVGPYRYLFEGEDDLLHLFVVRKDGGELTVEDAQAVARFLAPGVPPALVWIKPGRVSQHLYFAHELLLEN
jgi:hypothetical protein